jgi:hypothetical protein
MQLSQFNDEATLDEDGTVTVSGAVAAETDEHGKAVPRSTPVLFHFLIVQGDKVVQGNAESSDDTWSGVTDPGQTLSAGEATALGHALEVVEQPTPTFRTATWATKIVLKPSG